MSTQLKQVDTGNPVNQEAIGSSARVTHAAHSVASVTPSDVTVLATGCTGLWVGGVGNVAVTMWDGTTATFTAVPAGTLLPISPKQVNAATTATALVALH